VGGKELLEELPEPSFGSVIKIDENTVSENNN